MVLRALWWCLRIVCGVQAFVAGRKAAKADKRFKASKAALPLKPDAKATTETHVRYELAAEKHRPFSDAAYNADRKHEAAAIRSYAVGQFGVSKFWAFYWLFEAPLLAVGLAAAIHYHPSETYLWASRAFYAAVWLSNRLFGGLGA